MREVVGSADLLILTAIEAGDGNPRNATVEISLLGVRQLHRYYDFSGLLAENHSVTVGHLLFGREVSPLLSSDGQGILDGRTVAVTSPPRRATCRLANAASRASARPTYAYPPSPRARRLPWTVNRCTQWRLRPPGSTTRKSVPPSLCRPGYRERLRLELPKNG